MYEIGQAELRAVERVLARKRFFRYGGPETSAFEREWAALMGVRTAYAVTSGTSALIAGLQALGVGPGQSVLVPAYTFISTALAVTAVGAIPICVEVDERLTMDPRDVERKRRRHTSCIVPVHMQGMPCDMRALQAVAGVHGLRILEDCCQAVGGSFGGRRLGGIGDVGAYSFNQYKVLSCGEGGAVVTSDPRLAERLYMAQDGSCSVWPETGVMSEAFFCGGNFRGNEISSAILRVQARRLDRILGRLRATRTRLLRDLRLPADARFVPSHDEEGNCGVCFLIRADTVERAVAIEAALKPHLGAHRPIQSGRHVYSAWGVIRSRVGGHHPDWDCFRHPRNAAIETDYERPLPRTDDFLARTVLCGTPYGLRPAELNRLVRGINAALA